MVTVVKKGTTKKELNSLFRRLIQKSDVDKGFDAYKFCGKVKFIEDGLIIQKKLRNEWK